MLFKKSDKLHIPVSLTDKRDCVLSNPKIEDTHIRDIVFFTDFMYKSINDLYDTIIVDKKVDTENVNKIINKIEDQLDKVRRTLDE